MAGKAFLEGKKIIGVHLKVGDGEDEISRELWFVAPEEVHKYRDYEETQKMEC